MILYWFFILLITVLCGAFIWLDTKSTIIIIVQPYQLQISWGGLLILLLVSAIFITILFLLVKKILLSLKYFLNYRQVQSTNKTELGIIKWLEGDYQQAEQLLYRGANGQKNPILNYLLAAGIAHQRKNWPDVAKYLAQIKGNVDTKYLLALEIMRGNIQLATKQIFDARHTIDALKIKAPKHPGVCLLVEQLTKHVTSFDGDFRPYEH